MNRFLFTRFVLPLSALLLMLSGLLFMQGGWISIDSSAQTLLKSDPRNRETFDKMTSLLPDTTFVMVALEMENLFSNDGARIVAEASEAVMEVEGATEVKSLTHSGRPVRQGFGITIEPFIPLRATPEQWDQLKTFTTDFPLSRNVLVSADGRYAVLVGLFERTLTDHADRDSFRREFYAAMEPFQPKVEQVHILSFPFVEAEGYNALKQDLSAYAVLAGILVTLVLLVTFRSLTAVGMVLVLEALGAVILLGLFEVWDQPVDMYTGILFPLIGGLQLTFIAHYLSALQAAGKEFPPSVAAGMAFREVLVPSLTAVITTVVGLLTLAFADLPTVTAFGKIGSVAVVAVFLATFAVPALLAKGSTGETQNIRIPASGWATRPAKAKGLIFVGFGLVTAVLFLQVPKVRTDIRAMEFIEPGHPIRETLEVLNQELGGTNIFQVNIDTGKPYGLQTLPVLRYLEDLRRYAYSLEGVSDAYAYSQLYVALNQIWEGKLLSTGELPTSPFTLTAFNNILNASPLLFKDSFVDTKAQSALFILRSRDMSGEDYLQVLKDFMTYAEEHKPEGLRLDPIQGLHSILEGDRLIVENQSRTLGLSLAIIACMLGILWRSPLLAGAVLLANVPAMATIFGVMGFTGFPLNSITVMVAAVILGIAVDDGIHLVSAFRTFKKEGDSSDEASARALQAKFKPMACTSSILAVFLGLLLSTSFPPVAHFGILSAAGLTVAFLGAVMVLPAVLSITKSN
jgi:predicted RND superfamily exporter protein